MKNLKVIILLLFSFLPSILEAGVLDDARRFERIYLRTAIKVHAKPTDVLGTGLFTKFEQEPSKLIFTTNKHTIDGAKELELTVPITDTADVIIKTLTINVPLYKDTLRQYYIPKEGFDIVLIVIEKEALRKADFSSDVIRFASLPYSWYIDAHNLFVGQSVVFTGYPLGLTVNRTQPLLRKGTIAGIDTTRNIIFLDADAFGGSSGSPVFIDYSTQANIEFYKIYKQMLVGIISGYLPFKKKQINNQTGKIEMVQTENSGIAVVVPAETIRKIADRFLAEYK